MRRAGRSPISPGRRSSFVPWDKPSVPAPSTQTRPGAAASASTSPTARPGGRSRSVRFLVPSSHGLVTHRACTSPLLSSKEVSVMSQLVLHRGGWEATKADLACVPVPEATDSYVPVPYGRFIEEVELHVPRFGLTITTEAFALARDGQQMFGVLTCTNEHGAQDFALAIG